MCYEKNMQGGFIRPVGRWGLEEVCLNPSKDFIYTALTLHYKCPTVGKWSTSSFASIENHRCPSKSDCSYAGLFLEDQRHKLFDATAMKAKAVHKYVCK